MACRQRNTRWGPNQLLALSIKELQINNQPTMEVILVGTSGKMRYPRAAEHGERIAIKFIYNHYS